MKIKKWFLNLIFEVIKKLIKIEMLLVFFIGLQAQAHQNSTLQCQSIYQKSGMQQPDTQKPYKQTPALQQQVMHPAITIADPVIKKMFLEQLLKDFTGRPMPAIFRVIKKNPEQLSELIQILRRLTVEEQQQLSEGAGFVIDKDQLIENSTRIKKQSKDVMLALKQKLLDLTKSSIKDINLENQPLSVSTNKTFVANKDYFIKKFNAQTGARLLSEQIRHVIDEIRIPSRLMETQFYTNKIIYESMVRLISSVEGLVYFAARTGIIFDLRTGDAFLMLNERSAEKIIFGMKRLGISVTKEEIQPAITKFEKMAVQEIEALNNKLNAVDWNTILEKNKSLKAKKEPEGTKERKDSSKEKLSYPILLSNLSTEDIPIMVAELKALLMQKAPQLYDRVMLAAQQPKPQLQLLKLAYQAKAQGFLRQEDIQKSIEQALEIATNPVDLTQLPVTETRVEAETKAIERDVTSPSVTNPRPQLTLSPTPVTKTTSSISKDDLEVQSQLSKKGEWSQDFLERLGIITPFNYMDGTKGLFSIEIYDLKSFIKGLRKGSDIYRKLQESPEEILEKIKRVVEFKHGQRNALLPKDGHLSDFYPELFSLYLGSYRLLLGVEKLVPTDDDPRTARVVILISYYKGSITDKTEEQLYNQANQLVKKGQYRFSGN